MSWLPTTEPVRVTGERGLVALVLEARPRDLGGFRCSGCCPPAAARRSARSSSSITSARRPCRPAQGIDVRPHPHIGLATVTYLFEGEIVHRDSLGSQQPIRPGDVNWMTAGRGIVHSERTRARARSAGARGCTACSCGWRCRARTRRPRPSFAPPPRAPRCRRCRRRARELRVIAGTAYGERSPVQTLSPLFYVDVADAAGAQLALPDEHEERAAYVAEGRVALRRSSASAPADGRCSSRRARRRCSRRARRG